VTSAACPIVLQQVDHAYGSGALRREVLRQVSVEIEAGEIVLFTGPSGSGKTTLLTLIGALRSAQSGSLSVLGHDLRQASERQLVTVRRQIGYVFQGHNLLASLTARENVEAALQLHPRLTGRRRRARAILESVGLGEQVNKLPRLLSGGQRQRVAIARALATEPRIVLADEPTASLDKHTGREVVELLKRLARQNEVTVVVVTHDHRILDAADRVLHLEDGRLKSPAKTVMRNARTMMTSMAQTYRQGQLARDVSQLTPEGFVETLQSFTAESQRFRTVLHTSETDAFNSMLEQVLEAFANKVSELLDAQHTTVFLVDEQHRVLWSKFARGRDGLPLEIRLPMGQGVAGHVAATGEPVILGDAYQDPRFDRSVDEQTGYRSREMLCMPVRDNDDRVFAVIQVLNKQDQAEEFRAADQAKLEAILPAFAGVLQSWVEMSGMSTMQEPHAPRSG